jgi:DNA-binding MarR family transcriptional regulator
MLAWRGLLEVHSRLVRLLDEDLQRQAGLTVNEFDLLFQLWLAPRQRLRMKHLAAAVLVTPSGITRMVSRLQERGLVERINTAGRQAVETALTEAGIGRLHQAMDYHFGEVRRLFVDNLSATDISQLAAIWQHLHHALPTPPSIDLERPRD